MSISLLLEMAVAESPQRRAVGSDDIALTVAELDQLASGGAAIVDSVNAGHVAYVGIGGYALPALIFASARAGRPFTPLNYRLSTDGIRGLIGRLSAPLVVVDEPYREVVGNAGLAVMTTNQFLATARHGEFASLNPDPDDAAVVLFTSGTTSEPKAVELTHNNLTGYVTGTVEFASADPMDASLICVPPYHVAGVGAALTNLYAGRRMVYMPEFDAREWVRLVKDEGITTATVVPTMLERIVRVLGESGHTLPTLRTLAYGGSKVNAPLVRTALELLPTVGFVNAYGLTETSSTIAVLTPDDHRDAVGEFDPATALRLGSVGRAVPGVELQIRDDDGVALAPGSTGELFVRGAQVSGRYTGIGSVLDAHGWFATRDLATLDEDGYLFIIGRKDDTIIRGAENIAPAELEDVLVEHRDVREVVVVGVEDPQWGQAIVAVVVPNDGANPDAEELRTYVRGLLRSSRTPDRIVFRETLPTNTAGKVLRRELIAELSEAPSN